MKPCGYCGRENGEEAANCLECGTSFVVEEPSSYGGKTDSSFWNTSPKFRAALKSGGSVVLIVTAIIITIGRMTLDSAEAEHGEKIGKPGIYAVGMLVAFYALPVLAFVIPLLGLACVVRCKSFVIGVATIVLALVAVLLLARPFKMFLPVIFLGRMAGTSTGYYVGAVIHLVMGAWLLGWFDRWLKRGQPADVSETETDGAN